MSSADGGAVEIFSSTGPGWLMLGADPADTIANSAAGFSYRYRAHESAVLLRNSCDPYSTLWCGIRNGWLYPTANVAVRAVCGLTMSDPRDTRAYCHNPHTAAHMALFR